MQIGEAAEGVGVTARSPLDRRVRRWPWLAALGGLVVVVVMYVGHPLLLRVLGEYLVVEQPLEKADTILVLSGHVPFRAMEAAALYRQGWAPGVLLTRGLRREGDDVLQTLGLNLLEEHEVNRQILLRQGVPPEAIALLDKEIVNTWDELGTAVRWLEEHGSQRVIIVTSKSHTRRVTLMWRHWQQGARRGVVRWTPGDPFDPRRAWWKDRGFAFMVLREYLGLMNYWLGFPL